MPTFPSYDTPPAAQVDPLAGKPAAAPTNALDTPKIDPMSIPVHDHPDVVNAMRDAWTKRMNGEDRSESTIVVHGRKPDGTPIMRFPKDTGDYAKETFDIAPGDKAIIHTHPNRMDPQPSPADRQIADKYGLDMYTVSKAGLYRYSKGMKQAERIYDSPDFLSKKAK